MRNALATVGQMTLALLVSVVVSVVSLIAISHVQWPAFPSSNQLHALTTVGQVGCLAGLVAVGWAWRRGGRYHRLLAQFGGLVLVSAFSVVTLGMPLGATKLYLFGISVDQQFRTEYLTRFADGPALHDMTYQGLPAFYPPGWFWIGGRVAALTGTPAWEICKPWAITSITIAIAVALVLWWRLIRFEYALIVTTATAAVTLAYSSPEPYSAMITMLLPPVLVLTWSGLRAAERRAGRRTIAMGRGGRCWPIPRLHRHLVHAVVHIHRVHDGVDGAAAGGVALAAGRTERRAGPDTPGLRHRCHRRDYLGAYVAAVCAAGAAQPGQQLR